MTHTITLVFTCFALYCYTYWLGLLFWCYNTQWKPFYTRLRHCLTLCCLFNSNSILQPWLYERRRDLLQISPRQANLGRSIVPECKGKLYLNIVTQDIRGSFRTEAGPYRKNRFNVDRPEWSDHWRNLYLVGWQQRRIHQLEGRWTNRTKGRLCWHWSVQLRHHVRCSMY